MNEGLKIPMGIAKKILERSQYQYYHRTQYLIRAKKPGDSFVVQFRARELRNYRCFTEGGSDLRNVQDLANITSKVLLVTAIRTNEKEYYSKWINPMHTTCKEVSAIPYSYKGESGLARNIAQGQLVLK